MKKIFSAILLCLAVAMDPAAARTPGEVEVGGVLGEAQLHGLAGPGRKLSGFSGMPLLINVWASWCDPCRQEMGSLQRLHQRYGGKQFQVIGISTDDYVDPARAFLREAKVTFSNFIDRELFMENMLGADRLPLTLLVDGQGRVLAKFYGAKAWDSPEAINLIGRYFRLGL